MSTSVTTPARWNALSLVSVLLSLVAPVGLIIFQLGGGLYEPVNASTPPAYHVGLVVQLVGIPATLLAIGTGHSALDTAKRRSYRQPLRGIAILSLVLGYGALVAYFSELGVVYWALTHLRFHMHIVW
jgi:hypothetical protein